MTAKKTVLCCIIYDEILELNLKEQQESEAGLHKKDGVKIIKVIEGYQLKNGGDVQAVCLKLRSYAMTFPSFISAEHIKNSQATHIGALLYNWEKPEDWEAWKSSKLRRQILQEAEPLIVSKPSITIYAVMPTSAWTYTRYQTPIKV